MNKKLKHIIGFSTGIICMVLYILTLYPTVGFMDCGELAAACYTFGIPHPTGYPLFLLIGFIFSHLPIGSSIIYRLNLLSAVEASAAVVVTYYTSVILTEYLLVRILKAPVKKNQNTKQKNKLQEHPENSQGKPAIEEFNLTVYFLSFAAAVSIGLASTFWQDAIQVEVYALHSLFLSLILFFAAKIFTAGGFNKKNWIFLFIVIGFSFSNHLTTLFILPSVLYLIYYSNSNSRGAFKQVLPLLIYAVPGLLMYVILVIASSSGPYLNWSNVSDISNLKDHLSGADYSQLMFSSTSKFSVNAGNFFKQLPAELAYLPLLFSLAGLILLWKNFKGFVIFSMIGIVFTLIYAFNYNIVDINTYYLLAYFMLGLSVPAGIIYIISFGNPLKLFSDKKLISSLNTKIIAATLLLLLLSAGLNYNSNDNSTNYVNAEFTLNAINPLPQNSVVITYDWAYIYSASLYFQLAEKIRPDLKIYNIKFLSAEWYLGMIKKYHPDLYEGIKTEAEEYIKVAGQDPRVKAPKLSALVAAFIINSANKFPLYVTVDAIIVKEMKQFFDKFQLVPSGLVYRVEPKNSGYDPHSGENILAASFRKFEPNSSQKSLVYKTIPGMIFETANYHYNNKNFELSLKLLDKALEFNPDFKDAINLKNTILHQK